MKNITMNAEMAKAILDGRKTQTRRTIKQSEAGNIKDIKNGLVVTERNYRVFKETYEIPLDIFIEKISKYQKGDIICVMEPVKIDKCLANEIHYHYIADGKKAKIPIPKRFIKDGIVADWRVSCKGVLNGCIKEMARIFLKITDVRVERLHDITYGDMQKEGYIEVAMNSISGLSLLIKLWNKTAPKGYKWEDNPYPFVYEFERVENYEVEYNDKGVICCQ